MRTAVTASVRLVYLT